MYTATSLYDGWFPNPIDNSRKWKKIITKKTHIKHTLATMDVHRGGGYPQHLPDGPPPEFSNAIVNLR